jgi:branched-subunit amino acid transport protein
MTSAWLTVLVVAGATITIKAAGPVILGGRQLPSRVLDVVALLPAALLAALVAVLTLQADGRLVLDARLVGVAVAAVAIWLRTPILLVVVLAAAATAAARALGIG